VLNLYTWKKVHQQDQTMNHILINATHKEEIRVAIVKNKKLTDLNIETSLNQKNK